MTEQYKETLLNYLIGQLPNDSGKSNPILFDTNEQVNNFKTKIEEKLGTSNYYVTGLCNTDTTDKFIVYGYYFQESTYGFIVILDDSIQVTKVLTTYDSGTKFRKFSCLNFDEDGNLYGIDEHVEFNATIYRFIMLNNILNSNANSYNVILRQSYILDSTYSNFEFSNNSIKKVPNEATYFIVGNYIDANTTQYDIALLILKVNVGSENEWILYKAGKQNAYKQSFDFIIEKSENESTAYIVFGVETQYTGVYSCYFDGSNMSTISLSLDEDISFFKVISKDKFYFSGGYIDSTTDKFIAYIKEYKNGLVKEITYMSHDNNFNELYSLELINNNLLWYVIDYQNSEYLFKIGIYDGANSTETIVYTTENITTFPVSFFFSKNIYNLYKIFIQIEDKFYITSTVLNIDYSGEPYVDKNSLIPNNVILNSKNNTIFARNLYNKSINSNTTIATVEIPNTYLNNVQIDNKQLISETNLPLIEDTSIFTKNIYETVYLNFINSLLIKDKNDTSNEKVNLNASSYLNQKLNTTNAYDNAKMYDKAIIHFEDGSIDEIKYTFQDKQEKSVLINILIYITKSIDKIELISNNKETIYQTIDASNLEVGKLYKINQKVEVV